jgi:hypothetical protein
MDLVASICGRFHPPDNTATGTMTDQPENVKPTEQSRGTPEQQLSVPLQHVDVPELAETFADSIDLVFFDGQTLRINFAVTRFHQPQQSGLVSARRIPACRLVLTPAAAVELMNQIQRLMARMVHAGVLKPTAQPPIKKTS